VASLLREAQGATVPETGADVADEIARLELLRRLSMGAAHTLNNAFTAILGETLCLLDERKSDPIVAEACALIQAEVERCARLTRSVAMRVQRRENVLDETGMHSLLRGVEPLLRETVSRSISITAEAGDPAPCVRGSSQDLELLILLCSHGLVRDATSGALRLLVDAAGPTHVDLVIELRAAPGALPSLEPSGDPWQSLVIGAARTLADRSGIGLRSESRDESVALRLRLERAPTER
jgi:hypothetical protein